MTHLRQILLTVVTFTCCLSANAYDFEADYMGKTFYYNITSKTQQTCAVSYRGHESGSSHSFYSDTYKGDIVIPSSVVYNGTAYAVTSIGSSAFQDSYNMTSVEIPQSVVSIGYNAFTDCPLLESIVIPESVTTIGNSAFNMCTSLKYLEIPGSVTSIGYNPIEGCEALNEIKVSGGDNFFVENDCLISKSGVLICGIQKHSTIRIPNSVNTIGRDAFSGMVGMKKLIIGESVTTIEQYAFYGCTSLKVVVNHSALNIQKGSYGNGANIVTDKESDDEYEGMTELAAYTGDDDYIKDSCQCEKHWRKRF